MGFGNLKTRLVLKTFCMDHKPDLVFLSEPLIPSEALSPLYWYGMNLKLFVKNDRHPQLPNIWGICRIDLFPLVIANSRQQISISVSDQDSTCHICVVYAHTHYIHRRVLWAEIRDIMAAIPGLWCCIGDFNVIFGANEHRGPVVPPRLPSEEFKSFFDGSNLIHLLTRGAQLTWTNKRRGNALTEKRLDRCLCNADWLASWNEIFCCTLTRISSDHYPLLFSFSSSSISRIYAFRFHGMWLHHLDCKRVVAEVWHSDIRGCPMFIISQKLKLLKCISNSGPDEDLLDQEAIAQQELLQALMVEEVFWKENARMNWHINGDRNTSFFHRVAKVRQNTKALTLLKEGDNILTNHDEIATHVLDYFTALYASSNTIALNDLISSVIPHLVNEDDNFLLTKHPSNEEIRSVVFSMKGDGALGPDGFGGCFFQAFWEIIGPDVCQSVTYFFSNNWLPLNLNSNSVVLIPKHPEADRIEDFRPIALANFQFKIITKVLADRLALVAPKIISPQQRGFIKERHIHECICIASEAINLLDHKKLSAFGFNRKFTDWIKTILHSAKLSISVNGQSVGFFSCKRGVRQGDPLSPLLFCLAEDVLSRGISKLVLEGQLCRIAGPSSLYTPSHVLYVDDILIFCKGIKRNLMALKKLIIDYANASGQHISLTKCRFYSTSTSPRKIMDLSSTLGFSHGRLPFNYLGVPLFQGKPRKIHLQAIADRIILKLATWKGSLLSIMGRVELVKSIILSMLTYNFHIYSWPPSLIQNLDKCIRNFIWSGDTSIRKIATVSWHKVCSPSNSGDLGLRSIKAMNQAALIKLAWEMSSSNQEWAILYRHRFGMGSSPSQRYFKSSICPGIKRNWHTVISNSIWLVGEGKCLAGQLIASNIADIFIVDKGDQFVWQGTMDGSLPLQAAYNYIRPNASHMTWCRTIWSDSIPPSKSFTTWRLFHRRMPTDENLQLRGCSLVSMCNLCNHRSETSDHLFLLCPFAVDLWQWIGDTFHIQIDNSSLAAILSTCNLHWSPQIKSVLATAIVHTVNTIWHCMNLCRFQDS
ncbi:PREDICTED: uncharacterized protein LOC109332721 [Lupinus angustifolius]|uniref:uncharacterized protein LOC109332721 n=1 Tax=Lupinus angustifolius TaxID=3871 RepID=UPI00092E452E|nr:PREDICTED: uncharacterized protein LOC109332721 [Lupinus angustifolius]